MPKGGGGKDMRNKIAMIILIFFFQWKNTNWNVLCMYVQYYTVQYN